jgi:ubiquinone/menaquinone biosynthesis C-methylase UbiE
MKRQIIVLFFVLFNACNLTSQEGKIPVEPAENWLNSQHQPEKLMDAIGLREGMTIADIGAGRGRLSIWFADRVGETGKVYANDIDKRSLDYLEERCNKNNIHNIRTFLGKADDPLLPSGESDIAIIVSAYHHFEKPVAMLRSTIPCLKKDGVLVIVERDPVKTGQTGRESTSREKLTREAMEADLEIIKVNAELLESDNIYFLKAKN